MFDESNLIESGEASGTNRGASPEMRMVIMTPESHNRISHVCRDGVSSTGAALRI